VFRTYQAVLQPTAGQRLRLTRLLAAQRVLYNAALEERIGVWRWEHRRVSRFEQFRHLTGWDNPIVEFGICAARGTLTRLDRAFAGFYRRCRAGQKPGFPRFESAARWDSVEYPGCELLEDRGRAAGDGPDLSPRRGQCALPRREAGSAG
jgi:putative transposase